MEQDDIDTLLQIKKSIEQFNSSICTISEEKGNLKKRRYNKISNIVNTYNTYFDDEYMVQTKKDAELLINNINELLKQECAHEIEEDYVDIYPEKSVKIKYCKKCLLTL